MGGRAWDKYLTDLDHKVLSASGLGQSVGYGGRPALIVVDVTYNFCGDKPEPILKSIERWRYSCGEVAWTAVKVVTRLLRTCHDQRVPVFYTSNTRRSDGFDAGAWRWKSAREFENTAQEDLGNEIVSEIAPTAQDIVIYKTKPSAFYGTPLTSFLIDLKVDTLLICGVSTSGCVRATTVDAFSNNFRAAVIEDACFDRTEASHAMSLFDMHSRYADVVKSEEAERYLGGLPKSLFDQSPLGEPARKTDVA